MTVRLGTAHIRFILTAVVLWATAGSALAQHRVAYFSTLGPADAKARLSAIEKALAVRDPAAKVEYQTFRYQLPVSERTAAGQPNPEGQKRNEEIRAANEAELDKLLAWKPSVILAPGALPAKAAARRAPTIPVVFACKCNPLPDGFDLVARPERPEANITGFTRYLLDLPTNPKSRRLNLHEKRIELLREFLGSKPLVRLAAIHGDDYDEGKWRYAERAKALNVQWVPLRVTDANLASLPQLLKDANADAGLVLADTFLDRQTRAMVRAASTAPVPVIFPWDEAELGALMHYGTVVNLPDMAAYYLQKLLSGTKVADLPVAFPDKTELAFNLKTAKAQGWMLPRSPGFDAEVDRWISE